MKESEEIISLWGNDNNHHMEVPGSVQPSCSWKQEPFRLIESHRGG